MSLPEVSWTQPPQSVLSHYARGVKFESVLHLNHTSIDYTLLKSYYNLCLVIDGYFLYVFLILFSKPAI